MPRQSKNKFEIINDEIHITREGWPLIGLTTYREDYYEELTSKTWSLTKPNSDTEDKGYLSNGTLGLLHRYIAGKWYGEDVLKDMTEKGYVVDHMNNNHADCRISNLEFLKKSI
ncbi:HNH endonuclease [Holdemanella porci]|uniref:HNH endonuclease n=1 Tax=Holdemanella porci TaxID=2652276 RepID=UPI003F9088EE